MTISVFSYLGALILTIIAILFIVALLLFLIFKSFFKSFFGNSPMFQKTTTIGGHFYLLIRTVQPIKDTLTQKERNQENKNAIILIYFFA